MIETGWSASSAGAVISAYMVIFAIAVPFGGIIADKTGKTDLVIVISFLSFIALIPFMLVPSPIIIVVAMLVCGVLSSLAAGPVMTLPSLILNAQNRTFGMGVFFMIYYLAMMLAPQLVGVISDSYGGSQVALFCSIIMVVISLLALVMFRAQVSHHRQ